MAGFDGHQYLRMYAELASCEVCFLHVTLLTYVCTVFAQQMMRTYAIADPASYLSSPLPPQKAWCPKCTDCLCDLMLNVLPKILFCINAYCMALTEM